MQFSRRHFLSTLTFAGVCQFSFRSSFAEEAQPEVSKIRLASLPPGVCIAPEYVAGEMLRADGFKEIEYVQSVAGAQLAADIASGKIEFSMQYAGPNIIGIDAGQLLVNLAGVQVGCFELFAQEGIKKLSDLKGKQVGVLSLGSSQHVYLATILTHIGLDPRKDIIWVTGTYPTPPRFSQIARLMPISVSHRNPKLCAHKKLVTFWLTAHLTRPGRSIFAAW